MVAMADGRPAAMLPPQDRRDRARALRASSCSSRGGIYFAAFVRARESMAPAALGASGLTRIADRLLAPLLRADARA